MELFCTESHCIILLVGAPGEDDWIASPCFRILYCEMTETTETNNSNSIRGFRVSDIQSFVNSDLGDQHSTLRLATRDLLPRIEVGQHAWNQSRGVLDRRNLDALSRNLQMHPVHAHHISGLSTRGNIDDSQRYIRCNGHRTMTHQPMQIRREVRPYDMLPSKFRLEHHLNAKKYGERKEMSSHPQPTRWPILTAVTLVPINSMIPTPSWPSPQPSVLSWTSVPHTPE